MSSFISRRIEQALDKETTLTNLAPVVKLLDSILSSDNGIEQFDRLVKRFETLLQENDNFKILSPNQMVRLLKIFAYSEKANLHRHKIIDRLVKSLESRIAELDEGDVIQLLKCYQYLDFDVPYSNKLFNQLNQTIIEQALQNKDEVQLGFLINYLSTFFDLPDKRNISQKNYSELV